MESCGPDCIYCAEIDAFDEATEVAFQKRAVSASAKPEGEREGDRQALMELSVALLNLKNGKVAFGAQSDLITAVESIAARIERSAR